MMTRVPLFVRQFIFDTIVIFFALFAVETFAYPTTADEAKSVGLAIGAAAIRLAVAAVIASARKNGPAFLAWLAGKLGTQA